jgi:transcriptional regulator with XRE-family HTH domain
LGTLYENIIALCEEKGIKGGKMCTDIGMSKGILTDLKMGRQTGISAVNAQKIASYFNVTVGYLLGEEEKEKPTTPEGDGLSIEMQELVERIKTLPEEKVQLLLQLARSIE